MKKAFAIAALVVGLAMPAVALAAPPNNPSCWGSASAAFGKTGTLGQHASSFDSPRLGIGNVAFANTGTHQPGDLVIALGGTCP
jgi:hypothetical protein